MRVWLLAVAALLLAILAAVWSCPASPASVALSSRSDAVGTEPSRSTLERPTEDPARRSEETPSDSPPKVVLSSADPAKDVSPWDGRVVDDLGVPLPKSEVEYAPTSGRPLGPARLNDLRMRIAVDHPEGCFDLDDLGDGEWTLVALGPGDRRSAPTIARVPTSKELIVLTVPRAAMVRGTVLSDNGAAVSEAAVRVEYAGDDRRSRLEVSAEEPRARTNEHGAFVVDGLQSGEVRVVASHPEYSESLGLEVTIEPGATAEITLPLSAGGRIVGRIDPSVGETAQREISLYGFRGFFGWRETVSERDGTFVIEHVAPQDYVIELRAPPIRIDSQIPLEDGILKRSRVQSLGKGIRKKTTVREGETTEVVFGSSESAISVRGRVMQNGLPCAGMSVSAIPVGNGVEPVDVTTWADGQFSMTVSETGAYSFTVSTDRGRWVTERTIGPAGEASVLLEVPGGSIGGTILSAEGRAAGRVPLTVVRLDRESSPGDLKAFWTRNYRAGFTRDDGTFEFELLLPGTYTLRAPDGHLRDSPAPRSPFGGRVLTGIEVGAVPLPPIRVTLEHEGFLSGRVIGRDGSPVAESWIRCIGSDGNSRHGTWEISTDETGSFTVRSLAPGRYTFEARAGERRATTTTFEIVAGKTTSVELVLP